MTIHHAPALPAALALVAGIVTGDATFGMMDELIAATATILFAVVAVAFFNRPRPCSAAILCAVFCLGCWITLRQEANNHVELSPTEVEYDGVVVSEPSVHGRVVMFDMLIPSKPRLTVRTSILRDTVENRWKSLRLGCGIRAYSVIEPGYYGRGYRTFVYYSNWIGNQNCLSRLSTWERTRVEALKLRSGLLHLLTTAGLQGDSYAIAAAMALGDKSSLNHELRATYSNVGASHVLALSGLHLGIIYFVLSLFVRLIRPRWLGQALLLLTVWAFVVLVGMSDSVVRAAIMLTLYQMAIITNRQGARLNIVAVAAIVMLCANPSALFDIGFQLSYLAVVALIIMYKPLMKLIHENIRPRWHFIDTIIGTLAVTVIAQTATAPLVAYYFGTFSSCFILTSLVAIPSAIVILYGVLAVLIMSFSHAISSFIASVLGKFITLENDVLSFIGNLPGATIFGLNPTKLQVLMVYLIIICIFTALIIISKRRKINFN